MVIVGACLLGLGMSLLWSGLSGMRRGLRAAQSRTLVRGIRRLVTAVALAVFALALLTDTRGLMAFAEVFLAEELYETGVLLLILGKSERESQPYVRRRCSRPASMSSSEPKASM